MIIRPRVRGFLCTTSHPLGCEENVRRQIEYVKAKDKITGGAARVLVLGASTGYGLASRISSAFGYQAKTIGVAFEKPASVILDLAQTYQSVYCQQKQHIPQ